ncbi:phytanoyl-CoA dioxygenase family protein [Nostocaceae cyanobacterium CENA369]|uniref:Phytanoyl-CoA dioxygenase family protein n=1 Tax=Dendronalium phyllosphericum CENA369 TaxID=1725256 RepID=A0A8J7LDQ6_9NOST|nr:phytanoyl-CoA dioxygenase family protein [Dendronalium phyllosphericum]MBH8571939.1 phytanoyl-CoA dioxygenase family protein [Dendronalium phyllosphericum CENA369]
MLQDKILTLKSELGYRLALRQHRKNLPALTKGDRLIVDTLKTEGVYVTTLAELGFSSTSNLLNSANKQMSEMLANDSNQTQKLPQIYTVTDLPEFATWGNEKRLLDIVENYIGLPVAFQGVHLRKDFSNQHQFGTLLWHKDSEDRKMVKVIIYLTDVEEKHGPFEYIPLSLTSFPALNSYRIDYKLWQSGYLGINDAQLKEIIPASAWKSCPGKAGTVIITDPRTALHHGTLRSQERSALFFVYTANPPKRPELCTQYWDDTFARPKAVKVPV